MHILGVTLTSDKVVPLTISGIGEWIMFRSRLLSVEIRLINIKITSRIDYETCTAANTQLPRQQKNTKNQYKSDNLLKDIHLYLLQRQCLRCRTLSSDI